MCGGIVNAINLGVGTQLKSHSAPSSGYQLAYNAGRVSSYVLIGLVVATIGRGLLN